LGDITVDVVLKNIKNIHLSVHPPTGRVRISAPSHLSLDTIRVFAISKLGWIKRQQKKLRDQERETPREYLDCESHYVWGRRYLMKVVEGNQAPSVELTHSRIILRVRPGADAEKRRAVVEGWYRRQLRQAVPLLIAKWEPIMGVKVERFFVQRMKTRWGSCNYRAGSIRLNSDLAKKPGEFLEYIIVHEMVHMLEASHNDRFYKLMDRFMHNWQNYRSRLNRLPVTHDEWADGISL
jgi:predicted metal-dependent hydrolase